MADPISFVKALGTLLGVLAKLSKVDLTNGAGRDEVDALEAVAKSLGDLKGGVPVAEAAEPGLGARYQTLVLGAFLRAWNQFHALESMVRPKKLTFDRDARELHEELELRVKLTVESDPDVELFRASVEQVGQLAELLKEPLGTRWYGALWERFTEARVQHDASARATPLINVTDRWSFELYFLRAWSLLVEGDTGRPLAQEKAAAEALRVHLVRRLLLTDMAGWGQRQVFGNTPRTDWDDPAMPFMPLEEMYVEPDGVLLDQHRLPTERQAPITALIESLLTEQRKIIVVVADFGHGKSLTARTLAARWAGTHLASANPSGKTRLPVFVRCADCLDAAPDVARSVRASHRDRAKRLDPALDVTADDPIFAAPESSQDTVFLYDGLDEVVWGPKSLHDFFKVLSEKASKHHRFVVFSRPEVVPTGDAMRDVAVVRLQGLKAPEQVDDWLARWESVQSTWRTVRRASAMETTEAPPLSAERLKEAGLLQEASTPILLFLTAYSYALSGGLGTSRAALYEDFFWHVARGKFEHDKESHPRIKHASEELAKRLKQRGLLDPAADEPMAMLWLMSRVAWESSCREWQHRLDRIAEESEGEDNEPPSLPAWRVSQVVEEETGIRGSDVVESIQVGMLLALQADLSGAQKHILYGHQSFREFLAARYWVERLRAASTGNASAREAAFRQLYRGRLVVDQDRTIDFIEQLLSDSHQGRLGSPLGVRPDERQRLAALTWDEFLNEEPRFDDRAGPRRRLLDDRRPPFREAMLTISNILSPVEVADTEARLAFRSLPGYFRYARVSFRLRIPKSVLKGDFRGMDLTGADLHKADLHKADCQGARLQRARLEEANLQGSDFQRAILQLARLARANLRGSDLQHAKCLGASFADANLQGANLLGADLKYAQIQGANLQGANLQGADLQGANLQNVNFQLTVYDSSTRWPPYFDPVAAGAIRVPVDPPDPAPDPTAPGDE